MVYAGYLRAVPQSCHPNVKKQKRGTSIGGSPLLLLRATLSALASWLAEPLSGKPGGLPVGSERAALP